MNTTTAAKIAARIARNEAFRNERAALRAKIGDELGLPGSHREVIREANAHDVPSAGSSAEGPVGHFFTSSPGSMLASVEGVPARLDPRSRRVR